MNEKQVGSSLLNIDVVEDETLYFDANVEVICIAVVVLVCIHK